MTAWRREILLSPEWSVRSVLPEEEYAGLVSAAGEAEIEKAGRYITLALIDSLWADYLANVAELRGGIHWISYSADPLHKFLTGEREIYEEFQRCVSEEISAAFRAASIRDGVVCFDQPDRLERGATWTYVATDQPFGTMSERILRGFREKLSKRKRLARLAR
jgi:preprotein translocase subunit SecA